jgi:hypothetical protein
MNLKNVSVGGGLALLALAVLANAGASLLSTFSSQAHADATAAGRAAVASAMAQGGGEPTIVWYGSYGGISNGYLGGTVVRAWSDGTVELKRIRSQWNQDVDTCTSNYACSSPWIVISTANDGLAAFADLNADAKVDAVDLAQVLARWGDAPRNDILPSDCPLNLINP